jgi:hypothetical protein
MERRNKTKAERRELIFKMNYILLMFLTEKNLLEKFIDNCEPAIKYYNFNTVSILTTFCWSDFDNSDLWEKAFNELYIYRNQAIIRMKEILGRV